MGFKDIESEGMGCIQTAHARAHAGWGRLASREINLEIPERTGKFVIK
jgi:hypothetical protein